MARPQEPDVKFFAYKQAVPGEFIVTLTKGTFTPSDPIGGKTPITDGTDVATVGSRLCALFGGQYVKAWPCAGAVFCKMDAATAEIMSRDARVACVEANAAVHACSTTISNPGWGLDRIDQHPTLSPGGGAPNDQFTYTATGSNIDAWIVDTGIWKDAPEFNNASGRVVPEYPNATNYSSNITYSGTTTPYTSSDDDSSDGHGTAVADVFGGKTWGVARRVKFHAVKVLDAAGYGTMAGLLDGLNYVADHIPATTGRRSIVNMSLAMSAGYYTAAQKSSLTNLIGYLLGNYVSVVAAAGNDFVDCQNYLPAGISLVEQPQITVGGSQINYISGGTASIDSIADYGGGLGSNFGAAVDLFAPSKGISLTTYVKSGSSHTTYNVTNAYGTSFAAPYVAGVLALYLQNNPSVTAMWAKYAMTSSATTGTLDLSAILGLSGASSTTDRILYTNGL